MLPPPHGPPHAPGETVYTNQRTQVERYLDANNRWRERQPGHEGGPWSAEPPASWIRTRASGGRTPLFKGPLPQRQVETSHAGGAPATSALRLAQKFAGGGAALSVARRYADGGMVVGPVVGHTGGRADAKPVDVEGGSYVVPADIVAACGDGNTLAGHKVLERAFGKPGRASGGPVPIRISDGEHVLTREQVTKIGRGDHAQGCKVLDAWVKERRAANIQHLKSLPGPAKG